MKIGYAHCLYEGSLPYQPGAPISFGAFVPHAAKPRFCPEIYFRFPIRQPVTAVVWCAPYAEGGYYVTALPFDWSQRLPVAQMEEFAGESSGYVPQHATVFVSTVTADQKNLLRPWQCLVDLAEEYWQPLIRLRMASKLVPAMHLMSEAERIEFLATLGQSRNQKTRRKWREDFFIASRWETWERMRGDGVKNYGDRVADMAKHGLPMSVAAFKKRVSRLEFPRLFSD